MSCFSFVPEVTSEARLKSVLGALTRRAVLWTRQRQSLERSEESSPWGGWVKGIDHTLVVGGSSSTWLLRYIGIFTLDMTWCWIWEWRNSYHEETVNSRVSLPISFFTPTYRDSPNQDNFVSWMVFLVNFNFAVLDDSVKELHHTINFRQTLDSLKDAQN